MSKQTIPGRLVDKIGHFITIPHSVMQMLAQIGPDAFTLFAYLRYRTNNETEVAFPGYDLIEKDTGLTRRRIAGAIRTLEAAGLLHRQRRFSASTIYTLLLPDVATRTISTDGALMAEMAQSNGSAPLVQQVHSISTAGALPLVQQVHANLDRSELDQANKTDSSAPSGAGAIVPPPESSRKQDAAPTNPTRAIQDAYEQELGRKLKRSEWVQHEATAAKAIGEQWTPEQLRQAYRHYKADPFWSDRVLPLSYLAKQMPEYFRPGRASIPVNGRNGKLDRFAPPPVSTRTVEEVERDNYERNRWLWEGEHEAA